MVCPFYWSDCAKQKEIAMKYVLSAAILAVAAFNTALAADVGVSVSIGQPGFYGRIDIGDFPRPEVIFRNPIAILPVPPNRPVIYLHVPLEHARHWKRHCHEYHACGERVMFVQSRWYDREYVPRYRERHDMRRGDRRDEGRDGYRGDREDGNRKRDKGDRGRGRD
jgi:hypothetical protein